MMDSEFDPLHFAAYVRDRWLAVAISCGVAVCLAFGISEVLPRKFTATASVLIQPPGGNDPRAATQVSPVYLESLKSYERFASSDTLFVRAIDAVHARDDDAGASIESLKHRVLKVSKPSSIAVLEIAATLADPKKAQALASFIAQQTVELSGSMETRSSDEMTNEFRTQLTVAKARYEQAQHTLEAFTASQPVDTLENDVQETADLKFRVERDLEVARTDLADYMARRGESGDEKDWIQNQLAATRARVASLTAQTRELNDLLAKKSPELEARKLRQNALERDEKSAAAALEVATTRLNEALSTVPFRGERLQVIDPGIIPQQPSSPNTILNVVAALLLSLVGSLFYLAFGFGHSRRLSAQPERLYTQSYR